MTNMPRPMGSTSPVVTLKIPFEEGHTHTLVHFSPQLDHLLSLTYTRPLLTST